MELIKIIAGI